MLYHALSLRIIEYAVKENQFKYHWIKIVDSAEKLWHHSHNWNVKRTQCKSAEKYDVDVLYKFKLINLVLLNAGAWCFFSKMKNINVNFMEFIFITWPRFRLIINVL